MATGRPSAAGTLMPMTALLVGFSLGFLVAAQLGPISLLAIRSTLRSGVMVGVAIAGGVAVARRRVGPRLLRAVDGVLAFGGLLAYRTLRD
jgi:hypothetical protein